MTNHLQTYSCAKRVDSLHQWIVTMPLLADDVTCRIRSKGTDVACMHKSFFATFDRYVKHVSFSFHQDCSSCLRREEHSHFLALMNFLSLMLLNLRLKGDVHFLAVELAGTQGRHLLSVSNEEV